MRSNYVINLQTYKTTLSKSNQTAVPTYVINKLGLSAGDNLIWSVDLPQNTVKIKLSPRDWGDYLSGLGKNVWKDTDVDSYIKQGRQDKK